MPSSSQSADTPLNLADLDPAVWRVSVNGAEYGPYTLGQMQSFIREGRIGRTTEVSSGEHSPFMEAARYNRLASVFGDTESISPETAEASNFIIAARFDPDTPQELRASLSRALNSLGKFAEAMPGTFILRAAAKLPDVRRTLSDAVPDGRILIVEAREGRLGWLGLGSDIDQHIRTVWNANLDES